MNQSFSNTDWLTLALVVITALYAWATFKILRANQAVVNAMREQTEAQLRPYVVAAAVARTGTTLLLLEIQNTGKSPAEQLRLTLDKNFYPQGERNEAQSLAKLPAFTQVIENLAPGSRLQFMLGVGHTVLGAGVDESLCPKLFTVQASYRFAGRTYSEANTIDLRPLVHSSVIHDPVAEEVGKLRQALEKLLKK
jgi:hypothetical protein